MSAYLGDPDTPATFSPVIYFPATDDELLRILSRTPVAHPIDSHATEDYALGMTNTHPAPTSDASLLARTVIGSAMSDPKHPVGTVVACVHPDTLRPDASTVFILTPHGWVGGSSNERRAIDPESEAWVLKRAELSGDRAFLYPPAHVTAEIREDYFPTPSLCIACDDERLPGSSYCELHAPCCASCGMLITDGERAEDGWINVYNPETRRYDSYHAHCFFTNA